MYLRPSHSRNGFMRRDIEDLVMWIKRLVGSPGYERANVTSSLMKRCLPNNKSYDIVRIRKTLVAANLDDRNFDYILETLKSDYYAACSAAA